MKTNLIVILITFFLILCSGCTNMNPQGGDTQNNSDDNRLGKTVSQLEEDLSPGLILDKADNLLRSGNYSDADLVYVSEIENNSTNPRVWFNHGVALVEAKKYPEATEAFERAEKLGLSNKNLYWYNRGMVNLGIGHYEEANEYFKMIDQSDPLYPNSLILAGIANKLSKHGEGLEEMEKAIKFEKTQQIASENIELFNLEGDIQFCMPSFVKSESIILPKEGHEETQEELENLVAEYYRKHEYSKEDLFVCTDMALDLWDQLKAKKIPAYIVIGSLEKRYPMEEEFNHAWVVAEPISGKYVAMDPTSGEVNLTSERYYHGFYFDNPKNLKEYTDSIEDYKNQANVVARIVDRYNERWYDYSTRLNELNNDIDTYNRRFAGRSLSPADYALAASLESDIDTLQIKVNTMKEELYSLDDQVDIETAHLYDIRKTLENLPIFSRAADRLMRTPPLEIYPSL